MSEPFPSPRSRDVSPGDEGELLQFDHAEFDNPETDGPTCFVCRQPIAEEYYEIDQKIMCPSCQRGVEASFWGGSRMARFVKATAFGVAASLVGAIGYYAFVRITNLNLGLIAVAIGFLVGTAVRKGSGNRGGRIYQLLAVFLAYSSIVGMNVPIVIEAIMALPKEKPAAQVAAIDGEPKPRPAKAQAPPAGPDAKPAAPAEVGGKKLAARADRVDLPNLSALALLIGVFYLWPVYFGSQNLISGMIYAFALWEAWKINRPVRLVFNGPFRFGGADAPAEPEVVADGS